MYVGPRKWVLCAMQNRIYYSMAREKRLFHVTQTKSSMSCKKKLFRVTYQKSDAHQSAYPSWHALSWKATCCLASKRTICNNTTNAMLNTRCLTSIATLKDALASHRYNFHTLFILLSEPDVLVPHPFSTHRCDLQLTSTRRCTVAWLRVWYCAVLCSAFERQHGARSSQKAAVDTMLASKSETQHVLLSFWKLCHSSMWSCRQFVNIWRCPL